MSRYRPRRGPRARLADAADRGVFLQRLRAPAGERPGGGRCILLDLPLRPPVAPGGKPAEAEKPVQGKNAAARKDRSVVAGWSAPDGPPSNADQNPGPRIPGGKLAVVNLHGSFADHHPFGIEPETLTIDSILGTLYANFR